MKKQTTKKNNIMKGAKKEVFTKYKVLRNSNNDIIELKQVKESKTLSEITNNNNSQKKYINDVNKIHSNYNNLITFENGNHTTGNVVEYAIIKSYIKDTLIINKITNDIIYLDSEDLSINDYLKDYTKNNIYYYNNEDVIVIR